MLRPWAKNSAAPCFMLGLRSFSQMPAWSSSGVSIITTSAHLAAASATSITFKPAFSALAADLEPARRPTATSFTPESLRFSACAWPWLP